MLLTVVSDSGCFNLQVQEFGGRSTKSRYLVSLPLFAVVASAKVLPRQPSYSNV